MIGPGGCASTCPDDLKMEGQIALCEDGPGGPPPCAATCPRDYHPSCDEFRGMIAPGGCGYTCSDELKREYEAMLCPAAPPPGSMGSMGSMMGPPPPYPPPGSMGSMSGMGSMGSMGGGSMGPPPPAPGGLPCDMTICGMYGADPCFMPMCMGCPPC